MNETIFFFPMLSDREFIELFTGVLIGLIIGMWFSILSALRYQRKLAEKGDEVHARLVQKLLEQTEAEADPE